MKTKLFITSFWLLLVMCSWAQKGIINNGAKIIITSNAILDINGGSSADYNNLSVDVSNQGRIDLQGKIKIEGDWYNQASGGNVFINSATDGEIVFDGSTQQIIGGSAQTYFEKVTLNNNQGVLLSVNTLIKGNFTFTSGLMKLDSYNLYLDTSVTIGGTPSSTAMILPNSSGSVYKYFKNAGSFTFPVGDTLATDEYSPLTLTFNSGTFGASAYAKLNVFNQKHPNNASSASYLNRYWNVSTSNISGYSADVSAYYSNADIAGTEGNIYLSRYNSPYWDRLDVTNTALNKLSASSLNSLGDFTGAESSAVTPAIALSYDGLITEGAENNEVITITLANDDFVASLNTSNWIISNLPQGVSKGTLTRTGNKTATIALSGNRTKDFDSNITNVTISIAAAELIHTSSGNLSASSGVVITATNDTESIVIADDGLITEGSENGEIITVTAVGGTFASTLTPANWVLTNLPTGVSKGSVTRVNATTVQITLSGNASVDYDTDITNASLSVTNSEIDEYAGVNLTVSTGVTFKAIDESLTITMDDDGSITEGSENGESIVVTISGRTFTTSLTPSNWILSNLPEGVTKGSVTRNSSTQVTIVLSGTATKDFDADITNVSLQINPGEIDSYSSTAFVTSGVSITATDDAESISLSDNGITEGAEDGKIITVTLMGGTFASSLTSENWNISNLPVGVTVGSITKITSTSVEIVLSGNRCCDYDTDITNLKVSIAEAEIDDYTGANLTANSGVLFEAINDIEILTMSDDGEILEGNEDGEVITVSLSGGTIITPITPANWVLSGLPSGISQGDVSFLNNTTVTIELIGTATEDYDSDWTTAILTVETTEINDTTGSDIVVNSGITFTATDEPVYISLTDSGIAEGSEEGETITVALFEDMFVSVLNTGNWHLSNLPVGVTLGYLDRITDDTVQITLSGNRTKDYDSDITDVMVTIEPEELVQHHTSQVSQNAGILFDADNDAESLYMADDGSIVEGSESGEIITVTIQGGTFSDILNPSNWNFYGLPSGVSLGTLNRVNESTVVITLSGDATIDYDSDITNISLAVNEAEIDDYSDDDLTVTYGVTFTAVIETIDIAMSDDGNISESHEDGEVITVAIHQDLFAASLNTDYWYVTHLPYGVSIGSLNRLNDSVVEITLSGNRLQDYDSDINNLTITINQNQFLAQSADVVVNSGVTFVAQNDSESLLISDNGDLIEGQEDGKSILVEVFGGTFTDNLSLGNWSITNLPGGVQVGSIFKTDTNKVEITLSGNRTSDYDTDITDFSVSVNESEIDDYSGADLQSNSGVIFQSNNEQLSISSTTITEENLNGLVIDLELQEEYFADAVFDFNNFLLNQAPAGVSIYIMNYIDETHAQMVLSYDNSDFDSNITDFSVTVLASELNGISNVQSNNLSIEATVEATQAIMYDLGIYESHEDGGQINVVISENQLVSILTPANWVLENLPAGVTLGSLTRISNDTAVILLSGNRTTDYDETISNMVLTIGVNEFVTETTPVVAISEVMILADNDSESLIVSDNGINEGSEDGAQIYVYLDGGTYSSTLIPENWTMEGLPAGVTMYNVLRIDSVHAVITLQGNALHDYDADITTVKVIVKDTEIDDYSGSDMYSNTGILFKAINDDELLSLSDDGNISEGAEDGEIIHVTLTGGTFVTIPDISKWEFFNLPLGVYVSSLERISDNLIELKLSGNRIVDYDESNYNFAISVNSDQIYDFSGSVLTADTGVVFNALQEEVVISSINLNEESLNGAEIQVTLNNETFTDALLDKVNFSLTGFPISVTKDTIIYMSASTAKIRLSFNGTDFDANYLVSLSIDKSEVSSNTVLLSDTLEVVATNDEEILTMSDDGLIIEGTEDGEQIWVTLSGGTFNDVLNSNNWSLFNVPAGITIGSLTRYSNTSVMIMLSGNASQDYDTDITDASLQINQAEVNDYQGSDLMISSGVQFSANVETLTINSNSLTETNLNGAVISLALSQVEFTDNTINSTSVSLINAPQGLSVSEVQYINPQEANLILRFDGTDFDDDISGFYIQIDASELTANESLISNSLSISAIIESQTVQISFNESVNEHNLNNAIVNVALHNDKFMDTDLLISNFTFIGIPKGVSLNSVNFLTDSTASMQLTFDETDFDSDYTNVKLTIAAPELIGNSSIISNNISITAIDDVETITMNTDGFIGESSENGEVITFNIQGGTFSNILTLENWIINNLPDGVVPGAILKIDNKTVAITLFGNSIVDYDQDITNVNIQISSFEFDDYEGEAYNVEGDIIFTAIIEPDPKYLVISSGNLSENNLDGTIISANLIADSLIDETIEINNIKLLNAPIGTSVSQVDVIDSVNFTVTLSFDGTDFDTDYNDFKIALAASELNGNEEIVSNNIQIRAVNELQMVIIESNLLFENQLNNDTITLTLINDKFIDDEFDNNSFSLYNSPGNTSIKEFISLNDSVVQLVLNYYGPDFDSNINNFSVLVHSGETQSGTSILSNSLTIYAIDDEEIFTLSYDGTILEGNEDGEKIDVYLTGGTFGNIPQIQNWNFLNLPNGVVVGSLLRVDSSLVQITLTGNSLKDYDTDITDFAIIINESEFDDHTGSPVFVTGNIVFSAIVENPQLTLSPSVTLTENNLNDVILNLEVSDIRFDVSQNQNIANIVFNNVPQELIPATFNIVNDTMAEITMSYSGSDFDTDFSSFSVTLGAVMLNPNESVSSNSIPILASIEPVISVNYDGNINEGSENGELIQLLLSEGKFKSSIPIEKITLTELPEGVSLANLQIVSETQLTFELFGNRATDFDADISNIQCQVQSDVFQNYYQVGMIEIFSDIIFHAYNEQLTIFHEGLTEENLNGAILQLSLTDDYFIDNNLSPSNITLNNAPQGVTFDEITYIDSIRANLPLKYDGTDFTNTITNFSISVNPEELHGLEHLQSNTLQIEEGVGIFSDENFWNLKIFAKFASVYVTIDNLPTKWESAKITIFDSKGVKVYNSQLNQLKVNKFDLNVLTGYYMVLVQINGKEFIDKVFILPE